MLKEHIFKASLLAAAIAMTGCGGSSGGSSDSATNTPPVTVDPAPADQADPTDPSPIAPDTGADMYVSFHYQFATGTSTPTWRIQNIAISDSTISEGLEITEETFTNNFTVVESPENGYSWQFHSSSETASSGCHNSPADCNTQLVYAVDLSGENPAPMMSLDIANAYNPGADSLTIKTSTDGTNWTTICTPELDAVGFDLVKLENIDLNAAENGADCKQPAPAAPDAPTNPNFYVSFKTSGPGGSSGNPLWRLSNIRLTDTNYDSALDISSTFFESNMSIENNASAEAYSWTSSSRDGINYASSSCHQSPAACDSRLIMPLAIADGAKPTMTLDLVNNFSAGGLTIEVSNDGASWTEVCQPELESTGWSWITFENIALADGETTCSKKSTTEPTTPVKPENPNFYVGFRYEGPGGTSGNSTWRISNIQLSNTNYGSALDLNETFFAGNMDVENSSTAEANVWNQSNRDNINYANMSCHNSTAACDTQLVLPLLIADGAEPTMTLDFVNNFAAGGLTIQVSTDGVAWTDVCQPALQGTSWDWVTLENISLTGGATTCEEPAPVLPETPVSVTDALAITVDDSPVKVIGVITNTTISYNADLGRDYAVEIADVNDPSTTIVVQLSDNTHRSTWGPNSTPSVVGKTIIVTGERDLNGYSGRQSVEKVSSIVEAVE